MLRIHNLGKRHGDHLVFQGLTHTFQPGCVALCEEESTGKSTLLAIIAGLVTPSEGEVWIEGRSLLECPQQVKPRIAYVPDNCLQFPALTGRELLEQTAAEKNASLDDAVFELAGKLELEPHLDKRFEQMSTGTRRKVYLAAAALGKPAVVIADGPTNGVDSRACTALAEQFRAWSHDRVVLFASHDAEFVQACQARTINIAAP
ncbi:ATP-binding cassette domain-containing protein [Pusillimonas sp.]|uniref:ABC transporter ATP-binding protein n=1 Tax=Pusillimonas sp. TaxID=3040095 RepID=UPI0037C9DCF9